MDRTNRILLVIATLAFAWAVAGNYLALPGYLRFLERGGTSEAGNAFDMDVLLGALRTIAWMLAFSIGAFCLYLGALRTHAPEHRNKGLVLGALWLLFWMQPELPAVGAWFYVLFGSSILLCMLGAGLCVMQDAALDDRTSRFLTLTGMFFFAVATWDVCGLGATGRILHPDQVVLARSQTLLHTQVVKLMIAFVLAWGMILVVALRSRRAAP